jgi:hypothetical protein
MEVENMQQLIEGVYHDGHIDVKIPIPLKNNTKVKLWIITDNKKKKKPGFYKLGKVFDKINIRDLAHENFSASLR